MLKSKIYDFSNSFTAKQQNYLCRFAFHVNGLLLMDYIPVLASFSQWVTPRIFISGVDICISLRTGLS